MANRGFNATFNEFLNISNDSIISNLNEFVVNPGTGQINAWKDSIKVLKSVITKITTDNPKSKNNHVILEYLIPLETRRIDAVFLLNGLILIIEFKGKNIASQADVDQALAYERDIKSYHVMSQTYPVECCLVLTKSNSNLRENDRNLNILSADMFSEYCLELIQDSEIPDLNEFLSEKSYQPIPSLIQAARELFTSGNLKRIYKTASSTEPALNECYKIIKNSSEKKRRSLILINGVPGAGKTLIGLQLAHANHIDNISSKDDTEENSSPISVFLSGNAPLVEVLQYELKSAGGGGKPFVRGVHDYVKSFTKVSQPIPPHHVLIYDEAQRAFDEAQVGAKHKDLISDYRGLSEPELFVQFAERVPEWSVVVGLIGTGQEIHIGEEGGIVQWKSAIEKSKFKDQWDIHIPNTEDVVNCFNGMKNTTSFNELNLTNTLRYHLATDLYDFVDHVLKGNVDKANKLSKNLEQNGFNFKLTHDLELAKQYLHDRYEYNNDARYGLIASSRDKHLNNHGIEKGFNSLGEVSSRKYGNWYAGSKDEEGSCCELKTLVTEFGAQGLELDSTLLAWGTDLIRVDNKWNNNFASKYKEINRITNPLLLRVNAYRVLLTRGREGCVIFVPPISDKMRETYKHLKDCGFKIL